jgi:hypothetical protein
MAQGNLTIREYAVIEKSRKKTAFSIEAKAGDYTLLCEETYNSETILLAIKNGINPLITSLRTENMFPIKPNAVKIAKSVKELYDLTEDSSVELFFDDLDLLPDLIQA